MGSRKRKERTPLLMLVAAELGKGRITERFIDGGPRMIVHGLCEGLEVTINPAHFVCDTVIHELLHRMFPDWSENYVRNRTTWLKNQMTDAEVQAFYALYQAKATKRKSAVKAWVEGR